MSPKPSPVISRVPVRGLEDRPADAARIHGFINDMAPSAVPMGGLFVVPEKEFQKQAAQIAAGMLNGRAVTNHGGDENFGGPGQRTFVDGSYSIPAQGKIFISDRLLRDPSKLQHNLAHELGHLAADGDSSESAADNYRDLYLKRAQQAQKIQAGVQQLPTNAAKVLGGVMQAIQPAPQQILAGTK